MLGAGVSSNNDAALLSSNSRLRNSSSSLLSFMAFAKSSSIGGSEAVFLRFLSSSASYLLASIASLYSASSSSVASCRRLSGLRRWGVDRSPPAPAPPPYPDPWGPNSSIPVTLDFQLFRSDRSVRRRSSSRTNDVSSFADIRTSLHQLWSEAPHTSLLTILSNVFAVIINVLKFSQSLYNVHILASPSDD